MSVLQTTVPGKLLLFGEHVVLSGAPGIAVTLPITLQAQLDTNCKEFTITGNSEHAAIVTKIAQVIWQCLDTSHELKGQLSIESDIPIGQGFGSSAALCAALAMLEFASVNRSNTFPVSGTGSIVTEQLTREERAIVWKLAHEGEKLLHGTPSGIDTGAVLHRGLNAFTNFETFPPLLQTCKPLGAWLVWGFIPRSQSARVCIEQVAQARTSQGYRDLIRIAEQSYAILRAHERKNADIETIGTLANAAMHCFECLRISTPLFKPLQELATRQGSPGGKLCGAGSGGAFWFIFNSKESAHNLRHELIKKQLCNFAELTAL